MDNLNGMPARLRLDAFTEKGPAQGDCTEFVNRWAFRNEPPRVFTFLRAPPAADPRQWQDERVGWGLVLPDNPALSPVEMAAGADAPEPIRALLAARSTPGRPAPVLRYVAAPNHIGFLRRDGADLPVNQSAYGTGDARVPRYLLIYGGPETIPWSVQYSLNATRFVGRLPLSGPALENYVRALLSNWADGNADQHAAVVWAVDHGDADITSLMRRSIAEPVAERFRSDNELGAGTTYLDGTQPGAGLAGALIGALVAKKPAIIVTTSHGMTGPLNDTATMTLQLGLPVDGNRDLVRADAVTANWQPGGAIWYAHACCSAGSDSRSYFDGLFEPGSDAAQVLRSVAQCGARVAPLPTALLGAASPLRAFVGHVEPTFDWTLEQPDTRQFTTDHLTAALYDELYQPVPIGMALSRIYAQLGGLYSNYHEFMNSLAKRGMLHRLLVARDIQSTVILGDPTAMLSL